jgi:hypothetical protein
MKIMNPKLAQMGAAANAAGATKAAGQMKFMSDAIRGGAAKPGFMSDTPRAGLGAAMSGPKVGLGTAMGMNKMAGAGATLGKSFGMKKGGVTRADGCVTKGHTKGRMI